MTEQRDKDGTTGKALKRPLSPDQQRRRKGLSRGTNMAPQGRPLKHPLTKVFVSLVIYSLAIRF